MSRTALLLVASFAIFPSGCIAGGGGNEIVYDEAIRTPVRFESSAASTTFHTALEDADRGSFTEGGGMFILFIAGVGGSTFHETQFYNAQIRVADADRDRTISNSEADAYAIWVEASLEED